MSRLNIIFLIIFLIIFSDISFCELGNVLKVIQLGKDDESNREWGFLSPTSICFGDNSLWILESRVIDADIDYMIINQYGIVEGTDDIILKKEYVMYHHRNDLDGFDFVNEGVRKYIWTTRVDYEEKKPQLYQLDPYSLVGVQVHRDLFLPEDYYPTGITLDNNLNIFFIDSISRKVYKINYSEYNDKTGWIFIESDNITELFTIPLVNNNPSIPMGIKYSGMNNFYITLAGKEDYIIKTDIDGNILDQKNLHDYVNEEHKSRMPTDLTIDGAGYIWYTDCDYDKLYKIEKE